MTSATPAAPAAPLPAAGPLADFVHLSWRDDEARDLWGPRLAAIGRAWAEIEWRSVVAGVRRCGLTVVSPDAWVELSARLVPHGLTALPLALHHAPPGYTNRGEAAEEGAPLAIRVVMARLEDALAMRRAWHPSDDAAIGELLGFPACCRRFFQRVWNAHDRVVDTAYEMAANGERPEPEIRAGEGGGASPAPPFSRPAGASGGPDAPVAEIAVSGPPEANILLRWIGVRAVPHLPCSFRCGESAALGRRLVGVGRGAGFGQEMDWLLEALAWPTTWRAAGAIATIETPVLGFATNTNPTPEPRVVRFAPA